MAPAYHLYGMLVRSEIPLSAPLCKTDEGGEWDVELLRAPSEAFFPHRPADVDRSKEPWFTYRAATNGGSYLRWRGIFEFLIPADGRTIYCRALKGSSPESFRTYLLGQVLSFALLNHGTEPLHATAVVVDGKAIALMGDCGYGKSSLGAAFVRRGFGLLTDDLLVLREGAGGYVAQPGVPRLKLFPSVAARVLNRDRGRALNPETSKLVIPLTRSESHAKPAPLAGIYLLPSPETARRRRSKSIRILPVSPRTAFLELVRNTFNPVVSDPDRLGRQFLFAERLARRGLVRRLSYPRRLELLPGVCDRLVEDLLLHD